MKYDEYCLILHFRGVMHGDVKFAAGTIVFLSLNFGMWMVYCDELSDIASD